MSFPYRQVLLPEWFLLHHRDKVAPSLCDGNMAQPSTAAVAAALPFTDIVLGTLQALSKYSVAEFMKPKVGLKKSQTEAPLDLTFRSVSLRCTGTAGKVL